MTYYHKLNDYWHIAFETWNIHETRVPNLNNPSPRRCWLMAARRSARSTCRSTGRGGGVRWRQTVEWWLRHSLRGPPLKCKPDEQTFLLYVNYSPNKLNNFSLRTEYFNDP